LFVIALFGAFCLAAPVSAAETPVTIPTATETPAVNPTTPGSTPTPADPAKDATTASSTANASDTTVASGPVGVRVNVFAVVSPDIEEQVKVVGTILKDQLGMETFAQKGFQIHCTLYMTHFLPEKTERLTQEVASLAATLKTFDVQTTGLMLTKDNWLFLNLEKNKNLNDLMEKVVKGLYNLRSDNIPVPEWLKNYPEKMSSFKVYGSPNVFEDFEPHLTLVAKGDFEKLAKFIVLAKTSDVLMKTVNGRIVGIGVGLADDDGQVQKAQIIFPLKP